MYKWHLPTFICKMCVMYNAHTSEDLREERAIFSPSSDTSQNLLILRTESGRERRREVYLQQCLVIRVDKLSESSAGHFPSIMTLMNLISGIVHFKVVHMGSPWG